MKTREKQPVVIPTMKAGELRPGNIVYLISQKEKKLVTIDNIALRTLLTRPSDIYRPASLEEEHLTELGFKKQKGAGTKTEYVFEDFMIYSEGNQALKFFILINETGQFFIDYIHQLQNLYFTLFSKELTMEEQEAEEAGKEK